MFSREDALKIKDKVEREGIFIWKKELDTITAIEVEFYLYSDEDTREKHIKKQKELGWFFQKDQAPQKSFYVNFHKKGEDIFIYSAFFTRDLEVINWNE